MFARLVPKNVKNMRKWAWSIAGFVPKLAVNAQKFAKLWQLPLN